MGMQFKLKRQLTDKPGLFSTLVIKEFNEELREFTGIATTPTTDRVGDIVESEGAVYKLPIPLIWMHYRDLPVGSVIKAKITKAGIEVTCRIAQVLRPAGLVARLEEAWESVKAGLVRGLSIGFSPIEYSFMDNGGVRFTQWEWMELSLVTIPANQEAGITSIKSMLSSAAALGKTAAPVVKLSAGVAANQPKPKQTPPEGNSMKSIAQQLADFKAAKLEKQKAMQELLGKSEGSTLDAAQAEEFDTLQAEIKAIDAHITRLESVEAMNLTSAKSVTDDSGMQARQETPATAKQTQRIVARAKESVDKGIGFARLCRVKALAFTGQAGSRDEITIAKQLYPGDDRLLAGLQVKAPVPAASTLSDEWAGNLINDGGVAFADFVEYLRPRTLYGQVADRFRRLPFDTPVLVQGSGGTGYWVKEGEAKPLTQWTYTRTKLTPLKVAAIAAATKETLMRASVSADTFLRDELARAVGARIDGTLVSDDAAVTDESPAGLLNGTAELTLTGDGTIAGIRCDIATFMTALISNNLTVSGAIWVMPETVAVQLALATNEVGGPAFPGMTPTGGTLAGLPAFASQYVPIDSNGPIVALIKADEVFLGDEGGLTVSVSDQASLQMDSDPTQNSTTPTGSSMVSMFQTNSVAFLVERFLNWQKRRAAAVVWAHVNWNVCATP